MIDISIIREQPKLVEANLKKRGCKIDIKKIKSLDCDYVELLKSVESRRSLMNKQSKSEATDEEERKSLRQEKRGLKEDEDKLRGMKTHIDSLLRELPNLLKEDVPEGLDDKSNVIIKTVGDIPSFGFQPKDYLTLAERYDLIDLERAAKVSGSRFYYLKNEAALLSLALVRYGLDIAMSEGFAPILPPVMISDESMNAMGYLEHAGEDETYHFTKDKLYFVGTSEQSVGPMHKNEIIDFDKLPFRYAAFSTCFRREAGSYGKDTKGILRVHQFDKLEMLSIASPDDSEKEHEYLLSVQEKFMKGLELPYRVSKLCAGDLGAPSARTYDIETWIPSQAKYRETHSASTTTDFQSRRLRIKYRRREGSAELVHMLNGTLVAVNRPLIAILECGQKEDGTIDLPRALHPYLFGKTRIQ